MIEAADRIRESAKAFLITDIQGNVFARIIVFIIYSQKLASQTGGSIQVFQRSQS